MMFLEGIRILDLSRVLAGPLATQILGDLGADVLKIESEKGDDTRYWGPPFQGDMAAYFQSCNRNKASLVLNLKDQADHARLMALAQKADVVIDNFPPAVRKRLGLTSQHFKEQRADLITMSVTGYRAVREEEAGYDIMIQAESGLMGITGPADGEPYKVGVALVDVLTGMMSANGILAALYRKAKTGKGAALSISLYQTALMSLVNVGANYLVSGKPTRRWGNAHPNIAPYQPFQLADGSIIIGAGNDGQFQRLCGILGIDNPEITQLDNAARVGERDTLIPLIKNKLKDRSCAETLAQLKQARVPAAPILMPHEALSAAQKWDPDALLALRHQTLGETRLINHPFLGEGLRQNHQPPPQLGERGEDMARSWLKTP